MRNEGCSPRRLAPAGSKVGIGGREHGILLCLVSIADENGRGSRPRPRPAGLRAWPEGIASPYGGEAALSSIWWPLPGVARFRRPRPGFEAHAHQNFALLAELDGARRVDGWPRRMTEARVAFPHDGGRRQEARGGLLGGAGVAELLRRRGSRRRRGCRLAASVVVAAWEGAAAWAARPASARRSRRAAARARARARSASASRGRPAAAPRPAGSRSRPRWPARSHRSCPMADRRAPARPARRAPQSPCCRQRRRRKEEGRRPPCSASDNAIDTRGARIDGAGSRSAERAAGTTIVP